jgi:hypothetical protein
VIQRVKNNATPGAGRIGRVCRHSEKVADMIQRHQDHHDAAKDVNRFDARSAGHGGTNYPRRASEPRS